MNKHQFLRALDLGLRTFPDLTRVEIEGPKPNHAPKKTTLHAFFPQMRVDIVVYENLGNPGLFEVSLSYYSEWLPEPSNDFATVQCRMPKAILILVNEIVHETIFDKGLLAVMPMFQQLYMDWRGQTYDSIGDEVHTWPAEKQYLQCLNAWATGDLTYDESKYAEE